MIKIAAMIGAPDLEQETLAVYSGDLATAFAKVAQLGYDGVELMTKNPTQLDGVKIRRWLDENHLKLAGLCTGHVYGEDGLGLCAPGLRCTEGSCRPGDCFDARSCPPGRPVCADYRCVPGADQ